MTSRRNFIKTSLLGSLAVGLPSGFISAQRIHKPKTIDRPVVISTWKHGMPANEKAWEIITNNGKALDAVEKAVNICESDPDVMSVGYGGLPDRDGNVTLDACIMDEKGNCGSVGCLQHIKNPISVARKVMEETPHIMLVGEGALEFALAQGFQKEDLLTEKAKERWLKWLETQQKPLAPVPGKNNHDTIGLLSLDLFGNIAGACTTSGLAWKYHGRVGDSPIIGAGLFVDGDVGAAAATGKGESVIKIAGTHLIVELMRAGKSPREACQLAIERIIEKQPDYSEFQVGFIALNKYGETGAFSLQKGFQYALYSKNENKLIDSEYQ